MSFRPVLGNFNPNKKSPKTNKATAKVNDEVPDVKEIEEKSFFQKNWYYIIGGLMVVMALSGTPPAEAQGQPQRR
jgi:nucleoside diphosphate kinase